MGNRLRIKSPAEVEDELPASQIPEIKSPGSVNTSPPATMAPADIPVAATLISLTSRCPNNLMMANDNTATKIVGQGSALARSATYVEDAVIRMDPKIASMTARHVKCVIPLFKPTTSQSTFCYRHCLIDRANPV